MNDARVQRVLERLEEQGLHQMLVCDPLSIWYLTGYYTDPLERFLALYLAQDANGTAATLFCNQLFPDASAYCERVVVFSDTDDPVQLVTQVCNHHEPLGIDKDLTARWLLPLMEAGAATQYRLASGAVDATRSVKDERERELMRAASRINDEGMAWLAAQVREGVTEEQIASALADQYRQLGADGNSFSPIVSFGANAADPHHEPDDTVLRRGDVVLFDVGCRQGGYCSDMTRAFFWQEATEHQRAVYECVRAANEAAEALVAPGVLFSDIDRAARSVIEDAGWGEFFTHRLGHQIGLVDHEPGDVSSAHHEPVEPGMCFSIEPGVYLEGDVGVRIEDLVIVTEDGCEVINRYPHDLVVLG